VIFFTPIATDSLDSYQTGRSEYFVRGWIKRKGPIIQDAELIEVSNSVDIYDKGLCCSRSRDSRHVSVLCIVSSSTKILPLIYGYSKIIFWSAYLDLEAAS
jgi:hypothetical protein